MADKKDSLSQYFLPTEGASQLTGFQQVNQLTGMSSLNGTKSGDMGFQNGSGVNFQTLDVATPCVFMPAVLVVMSVPLMYIKENGQPTPMAYLIKDLIENHARQVTGLDFGYQLDTQEAGIGNDGQIMMAPGKTKRQQPQPQFVFPELQGNTVFNCMRRWIFDINHPDTNAACLEGIYPGAWTMSAYTMSMLLIQYDQTMRPDKVIDGAFYTNMFPLGTGEIGFERTIGSTRHPERNITFSAIVQHNESTKALAASVASQLQLHKHNYNIAPTPRNGIQQAVSDLGYWNEHQSRVDWGTTAQTYMAMQPTDPNAGEYASAGWVNNGAQENSINYNLGSSSPQNPGPSNSPWYTL